MLKESVTMFRKQIKKFLGVDYMKTFQRGLNFNPASQVEIVLQVHIASSEFQPRPSLKFQLKPE
jgi:hypothetical protein